MDIDSDSNDAEASTSSVRELSKCDIRNKILNNEFKLIDIKGKSKIWQLFCKIEANTGEMLPKMVACKNCKTLYTYNGKCTSNLVRHKCYLNMSNLNIVKKAVDNSTKLKAVRKITKWTVKNCRPFNIVEDSGFQEFSEFLVDIGAVYGSNVDIKDLIPHPTTLSRNIHKMYRDYFQKIKDEILPTKNTGYSLTSDLWTDNYLKKTYIALTIHFIAEGRFISRLLGMKSMKGERCTSPNILFKASNILNSFDLSFEDNPIIVTDRGANMIAAFRSNNHICCIDHLLHNTVQKSINDVVALKDLQHLCTKLVKYFKISSLNSNLETTLKSFSPTRWNSIYYLLLSIQKNWAGIVQQLQIKNEMYRINEINLNYITSVIKILEPFEETFTKLEGETYPTIHLVIIYIYRLQKRSIICEDDVEIVKLFKERISYYLVNLVLENLTIFHKIALYLFPPANQLPQFDEDEKVNIKTKCKDMMQSFLHSCDTQEEENTDVVAISNHNKELFSDFVKTSTQSDTSIDKIETEISSYESLNVTFHDDFNILQWWQLHSKELPLMFKVSCKILSSPATSASSERVFSRARNIISEKRSRLASNDISINEIMFLHINIGEQDEMKFLETEISL